MNPKVFFILLVLLATLFLFGTSLNLRGSSSGSSESEPPDWAANLEERIVPKEPLHPDHIRSANPQPCLSGLADSTISLNPGQSCTYDIAKAEGLLGGPMRRVEVCLGLWSGTGTQDICQPAAGSGTAQIHLSQPDHITIRQSLPTEDNAFAASIDIFQAGGVLRIACGSSLGGERCLFTFR
jgi:hypothetical protein